VDAGQEPGFVQFRVPAGRASVDLGELARAQTVELDTPNAAFAIERTGYFHADVTEDSTTFQTHRGRSATMTPAGGVASTVAASLQVVVTGADAPRVGQEGPSSQYQIRTLSGAGILDMGAPAEHNRLAHDLRAQRSDTSARRFPRPDVPPGRRPTDKGVYVARLCARRVLVGRLAQSGSGTRQPDSDLRHALTSGGHGSSSSPPDHPDGRIPDRIHREKPNGRR